MWCSVLTPEQLHELRRQPAMVAGCLWRRAQRVRRLRVSCVRWYRDPSLPLPRTEITRFPHAILEVKLSLSPGEEAPEWVTVRRKQTDSQAANPSLSAGQGPSGVGDGKVQIDRQRGMPGRGLRERSQWSGCLRTGRARIAIKFFAAPAAAG
jgi:hypothetical protein